MTMDHLFFLLGVCVVACPALLLFTFGITELFGRPLTERNMARLTEISVVTGLLAAVAILINMLATGSRNVPIEFGNWVVLPGEHLHFHFHLKFVFDRLSVPFAILSFVLIGTIGAFANRYLHRDAGYNRFFLLYAVFLVGMIYASLAGTI